MFRSLAAALLLVSSCLAQADRRPRIDVESYRIDAEVNPRTQTLTATAQVQFKPLEDNLNFIVFELNNALNVSKVVDSTGIALSVQRSQPDYSVRVNFPRPLPKDASATITFTYDGRLAGNEESPVSGIKFASIQANYAYLLYPARWFPVNALHADAFSADIRITAPANLQVVASGTADAAERLPGERVATRFRFAQSSFPGSIALMPAAPAKEVVGGVVMSFLQRETAADLRRPMAVAMEQIQSYLTSIYGPPSQPNLTVVETDEGAPNGYLAPGILFLSPRGFGSKPSERMLTNQIARAWWGMRIYPATRNHIWLVNGMARYSELLYQEHVNGAGALETDLHDVYVEALTVENPPLSQASRLEDFSPEYWAVTGAKGAAVLHMLRIILGDQGFEKLVKSFSADHVYRAVTTDDFRKAAEQVGSLDLRGFFIQWIESTGAPEFKLTYTIYRVQKGFRVIGKINQDLDTFRMPVALRIETEGNPEEKVIEVSGTSSEFSIDTFGKPKKVVIDPKNVVLRYSPLVRVAVAIRRGEQFAEIGEYQEALREYQKALDVTRNGSLAHYRVGEVFFLQNNYQSAANEFRAALDGDLEPKWTEVWSHINLGKIFDVTSQRERAVQQYSQAARTRDNTQGAQAEAAKYLKQPYERPKQSY